MDDQLAVSPRPKIQRKPNYGDTDAIIRARFPLARVSLIAGLALTILALVPLFWSLRLSEKESPMPPVPVVDSANAAPVVMPPSEMLEVRDDNGEMVGQLAKMPADMERGMQVESVSKADKTSGKELMKIIGKY